MYQTHNSIQDFCYNYNSFDKMGQYQPTWYNYPYQGHEYNYQNQYNPYYYDNFHYNMQYQNQTKEENSSIFTIPCVLNNILSYSSLFDLKHVRLVSKSWNKECRKLLKEKITIKLLVKKEMKSSTMKLIQSKELCERFILGPRINLKSPIVRQFLTDIGYQMRSLEINCKSVKLSALKYVLYHLLPNLEELVIRTNAIQWDSSKDNLIINPTFPYLLKLKKLKLLIDNDKDETIRKGSLGENSGINDSSEDDKSLETFLKELVIKGSNLEEIESANTIVNPPCSLNSNISISEMNDLNIETFKVSSNPHKIDSQLWSVLTNDWDVSLQRLKKITLNVKISDGCVQKLATKWFPLTKIDLNLESNVTSKSLQFLFLSLKDTLKHIKLKYNLSLKDNTDVDLQVNETLLGVRSVELEGYKGNLRFVEYFPNIQALTLRRLRFNKTVLKDVESTTKPHGSLLSLKVFEDCSINYNNSRQRSVQTVQQIGQLFPSLRILRLEKLMDESLCLIYAQWPYLEELEIVEGQFTDSATTAIHPNAYKVILREEAYDSFFNVEALRQGLYLGNLTRLRKLVINSPKISDVTIILGVMMCPNIQSLSIKSFLITDTALRRMCNKPSLVHIETTHCSKLSPQIINYAAEKLKLQGGEANLNQSKGPMGPNQSFEFLRKHPKLKISLKRLQEKRSPIPTTPISIPSLKKLKINKQKKVKLANKNVMLEQGLARNRSKRIIIPIIRE